MAIVYESVILFGVLWFADYAFSAVTRFQGAPGPLRTAFQVFQLIVLGVYFVGFWTRGRRTLPMKTLSLQLVDAAGQSLTLARAALRFVLAAAMPVVALGLGHELSAPLYGLIVLPYAWTLLDRERRALYDVLAGTRLVVRPIVPAGAIGRRPDTGLSA